MRDSMEGEMTDYDDEYDPDEDLTESELNTLYDAGTPVTVLFSARGVLDYPGSPLGAFGGHLVQPSTSVSGGSVVIHMPAGRELVLNKTIHSEVATIG
jgi:hypothetical protein